MHYSPLQKTGQYHELVKRTTAMRRNEMPFALDSLLFLLRLSGMISARLAFCFFQRSASLFTGDDRGAKTSSLSLSLSRSQTDRLFTLLRRVSSGAVSLLREGGRSEANWSDGGNFLPNFFFSEEQVLFASSATGRSRRGNPLSSYHIFYHCNAL